MTSSLARLTGVVHRFGPVTALDGADLELRPAEVHGVLGENGAGKTTLLHVLGGLVRPDEGEIQIGGEPVVLRSPRDAWAHGVGLVHQHFTLVPSLSVLENLALGFPGARRGFTLALDRVAHGARELAARTGLSVPLAAPVEELGVGDRQRVEILKALLRRPTLLVLDEPTAVLTPGEVSSLFELLRALAREGTGVALVAHKLDEVLSVADRVTVLRHGRTVLRAPIAEVDAARLVVAMVGESAGGDAPVLADRPRASVGPVVARLRDAGARGPRGAAAVTGVTLEVRRGELIGIAGVEGNGQRELARLLAGRVPPVAGTCELPEGTGFVPQDRTLEGLVADFDLTENVALALHRDATYRRGPLLRWGAMRARAAELAHAFDVRAANVRSRARALSGGNQQRLVLARELSIASDLLVAENPTRGLDVAASAFVHRELRRLSSTPTGAGVVVISTDLDEILALSDRVLVIVRGRLVPVPEENASKDTVGALMLAGAPGG